MRRLQAITCAAMVAACGPKDAEDTDAGSTGAPDETSGDAPTGSASTAEEPTTGSTGSTGDETAEPSPACPEGQEPMSTLWSKGSPSLWEQQLELGDSLLTLSDGRMAVVVTRLEDVKSAAGIQFLSPTGDLLAHHVGATITGGWVAYAGAVDAEDRLFVLSSTGQDDVGARARLSRFAGDGALLGEVALEFPDEPGELALADAPVVAGWDAETDAHHLAKLDAQTGAPLWQAPLAGPKDLRLGRIAVAPDGDLFVVGQSDRTPGVGATVLRLWRFSGDGAELWAQAIAGDAFEEATDLQLVGDQLIALRGGPWPQPKVELLAFSPNDGAPLWQREVAESEVPIGGPWAESFHVVGAELLVPIARVRAPSLGDPAKDRQLELRRFTLLGALMGFMTVGGEAAQDGPARLRSTRGGCGELVLLAPSQEDALWLTGLAL